MTQTVRMTRTRSALLSFGVVALTACAPREAPSTAPSTDETSPPEVRTEFVSEADDDSIPNPTATTDDAPPTAKPDAPKPDAESPPPEQEGTAPSPEGTLPEAGAPPPSSSRG